MTLEEEPGWVAYEAWQRALVGTPGDRPGWSYLPPEERAAWVAAAEAVKRRYGAIY